MDDLVVQNRLTRVLVVDDERAVGRITARMLNLDAEFDVVTEQDPTVALEKAQSESFDVVLSDILMPEMDGLELIRAIRAFNLDIPVILLTGTPSLESAQRAVELGAFRYLTKSVERRKLIETVKQAALGHRIAVFKRHAMELSGQQDLRPGDILGLQHAFETAIENMWIAYQPIVNAEDGTVFGYECLLRSEQEKLNSPEAILDAARNLDRLHELGRIVREKAIEPIADVGDHAVLFVNLHPFDLTDQLLGAGDSLFTNLAGRIVLEITERESIDREPAVADKLNKLRSLGFRIALDDLGAGYAGLSSFATLQPTIVKLDMSLIFGISLCSVRQRLVRSMVEACHDLGVRVVAEGIETREELECCIALGCDLLQGFFIVRPVAASAGGGLASVETRLS